MIPSSTYRIQFRNGMTFDRVVNADSVYERPWN